MGPGNGQQACETPRPRHPFLAFMLLIAVEICSGVGSCSEPRLKTSDTAKGGGAGRLRSWEGTWRGRTAAVALPHAAHPATPLPLPAGAC